MKKSVCFISLLLLFPMINLNQPNVSGESNYTTNTSENDWTFIALGDGRQQLGDWDYDTNHYTHDNQTNPIREAVIDKVALDHPDLEFILHTGDIVANGAEQDDWNRYFEDIDVILENNISMYYAVGNHEYYRYALGPRQYDEPQEDLATYHANVEMPGNERFYSFDYNNQIHFVIINTNEDMSGEFEITIEQKDWLINDLQENIIDFVIVAYHHPSYSIRNSGRVSTARSVRAQLDPIFIDYDVDLVFSGHDHMYYRTNRNNIMYVTTGGAGANLYQDGDRSDWQEGDVYFSNYHYCEVIVSETDLTVNVYSLNELDNSTTIEDNFTIPLTDPLISESTSSEVSSSEASSSESSTSESSISDASLLPFLNFHTLMIGVLVMGIINNLNKKKQ